MLDHDVFHQRAHVKVIFDEQNASHGPFPLL
jgi:hypothetical protein